MKKLGLLAAFLPFTLMAQDGWEGKLALVPKDTLLCDFSHMERALMLAKSGDKQSVEAYAKQGYCMYAPNSFYATVTNDASLFTDPDLVEITYKGKSIWAAMNDIKCCYKRSD